MKVEVIAPSASVDQQRWQRVHALFERLRHVERSAWHAELHAAAPEDPALAYEVLSLLVANESVVESQA
ncbi:MAG: hypothetical protein RLZZ217_2133 [Planctomycetota bacterium]|jgi:hypothetical protein